MSGVLEDKQFDVDATKISQIKIIHQESTKVLTSHVEWVRKVDAESACLLDFPKVCSLLLECCTMRTRDGSGLLGWVKSQLSTVRRRRSSASQHQRRSRVLVVEALENRELLSVTLSNPTWKPFDYEGTGTLSGKLPVVTNRGKFTANLAGSANVAGNVLYTSNLNGNGQGTVNGHVDVTVVGIPYVTWDLTTPAGQAGTVSDANGTLTIAVPNLSLIHI